MEQTTYSKVELLALIKAYNKQNNDKIKNADKLKKNEILEICKKYNILADKVPIAAPTDLNNVSKRDLQKDVEIYFLKDGKPVPPEIASLKKKALIEFMELHNITHHTQELLKKETEKYQHLQLMKTIIVYNIMKYDNVNVNLLNDDNLEAYIIDNDLDCNIEDLPQYSILLQKLYAAYDEFCKSTNREADLSKIKSFPTILNKLQQIFV